MARNLAFLLMLCTITGTLQARQYQALVNADSLITKTWTIDEGLPVNTITEALQDENGYLWLTTYDGLVRFDGVEFTIFNHANTPVIPHNRMVSIFAQQGVGTWITLEYGGVLIYNEGVFSHFSEDQGFTSANIFHHAEGKNGKMFFFTTNGVYLYEEGQFAKFYSSDNELRDYVYNIYEADDGSCWLATANGLVHKTREGTKVYNLGDEPSENVIYFAQQLKNEKFIVGTIQGLFEFKEQQFMEVEGFKGVNQIAARTFYSDETHALISTPLGIWQLLGGERLAKLESTKDFSQVHYNNFHRDSHGTLWLVGESGELATFKDGLAQAFRKNNGENDYRVNNVFEDVEGNMWLLTFRNGLVRIKKGVVKTIGQKEGLSEDNILGILEDSRHRFWIGTRGGGLNKIERNTIVIYRKKNSIASDIIQAIAEDETGRIWVGHYQNGIDILSEEGVEHFDLGNNVDANDIRTITFTKAGEIWIGTYGGLVKLDERTKEPQLFRISEGLSGEKVRYVIEASDQSLWIGTQDGGVNRLKNGRFTAYTVQDGLSSNNIRSVYEDENAPGTIWVGTENNGLNRIRHDSVAYVNMDDGLPDYNIHWISEDGMGWLWMSSNKGVFKIKKEQLNKYLDGSRDYFQLVQFGKEDGMRNPEGNGSFQEAGIRTSTGAFWFSTQQGVSIFESEMGLTNNYDPIVRITKIIANGEEFEGDSIQFPSDVDDIQIDVRAITLSNPEKTKYRYRLFYTDVDEKLTPWHETGLNSTYNFNELSPGSYLFEVQATNSAGEWSPNTERLSFQITSKFYQRFWFWVVILVALVFLYHQFSLFRYKRLLHKQSELKAVIDEQTKVLREEKEGVELQKLIIEEQARALENSNNAKDKFFSIIAHDLKNPFQAMLYFSDELHRRFETLSAEEIKERIGIIRDSSNRLYKLTENLLHWSRLQNKQVEPEMEVFLIEKILFDNVDLFNQLAQQKNIEIHAEVEEGLFFYADKNMMDTVLRNLISNAIKFTPKGGRVIAKACTKEDGLEISISDSGIGMNPSMLDNLLKLDADNTREGTENEKGTGLGLLICQEMIHLNKGVLSVYSRENEGTVFTLHFKSPAELLNS